LLFLSGDDVWGEPGSPKVDGSGKGLRVAIIDFDHADPVRPDWDVFFVSSDLEIRRVLVES